VLATKPIPGKTKICNYMGYIVSSEYVTAHLPCSTDVVTPHDASGRTTGAKLIGIPNTIGPTINHVPDNDKSRANCTFVFHSNKFSALSTTPPPDWITVETTRDIEQGEELFLYYGDYYWPDHDESCVICFGRDYDQANNPLLGCSGEPHSNGLKCSLWIHLHCSQLSIKPPASQEYYCPLCIECSKDTNIKTTGNATVNQPIQDDRSKHC
jgi:hypothetical protein